MTSISPKQQEVNCFCEGVVEVIEELLDTDQIPEVAMRPCVINGKDSDADFLLGSSRLTLAVTKSAERLVSVRVGGVIKVRLYGSRSNAKLRLETLIRR